MAKASGKVKARNTESNRFRRIQSEITKCEKRIKKLLRLHEEGRKRWKCDRKKNKIELNKLQGMCPNSPRHEAMLNHLKLLRGKI